VTSALNTVLVPVLVCSSVGYSSINQLCFSVDNWRWILYYFSLSVYLLFCMQVMQPATLAGRITTSLIHCRAKQMFASYALSRLKRLSP